MTPAPCGAGGCKLISKSYNVKNPLLMAKAESCSALEDLNRRAVKRMIFSQKLLSQFDVWFVGDKLHIRKKAVVK